MSDWLYGKPATGDISDFRHIRMEFCHGNSHEHIMHKDHVQRFVDASIKLHFDPGINPANKIQTARIWRITSAPLHVDSYWWSTPSLNGNSDPDGAAIVKPGRSKELFVDKAWVAKLNRDEADLEDAEEAARSKGRKL